MRSKNFRRKNSLRAAGKKLLKSLRVDGESRWERLPPLMTQISKEKTSHENWSTWQEHGASTARWRVALRRNQLPGAVNQWQTDTKLKGIKGRGPFEPLPTFRKAIRMVILLIKAVHRSVMSLADVHLLTFRHYTTDIIDSLYDYGSGLVFNPNVFKRQKEPSISSEAKEILAMDKCLRTEAQLRQALVALTTVVEAFAEFPRNMRYALVRVGRYESYEPKRVIIRQGHYADNFYLIISGTTVVTAETRNKQTNKVTSETLAVLGRGNSFGELAIMHGSKRTATVTCQNKVELLAVEREDYVDIFMHLNGDKAPPHIAFLQKADVLCGWPLDVLPWNDTRICVLTYFRRGCVMCKDGNKSEWIYVVKTGRCRVLKCLSAVQPNLREIQCKQRRQKREMKGWKNGRLAPIKCTLPPIERVCIAQGSHVKLATNDLSPTHHATPVESVHRHTTDDKHSLSLKKYAALPPPTSSEIRTTKPRYVEIQNLGPHSTFGLEPIAFGETGESTSGLILVSEGAEVVLIKKSFFLERLTDDVAFQLRTTIRPYPKEDGLQQRLQDETNWKAFKMGVTRDFVRNRHCYRV